MRVLYLALAPSAYGETVTGLELADQLSATGVEGHFVVQEVAAQLLRKTGYGTTVVDPSMGRNAEQVIRGVIESWRPDAIVLSDYFMWWIQAEKVFRIDPWFIEEYDVPVVPIDWWEWAGTDFRFDLTHDDVIEVSDRILGMPAHLRPVPMCHLTAGGDRRAFPYRVRAGSDRVTDRVRGEVRRELGLGSGDRLVMLPVSQWQSAPEHLSGGNVRLAGRLPDLIAHYLRQLPASTHVMVVGHTFPAFAGLPTERFHHVPVCPPAEYSRLIGAADLLFTLNQTSPTLIRAVLADVPGLGLRNSFRVAQPSDVDAVAAKVDASPTVHAWLSDLVGVVEPFAEWPMNLSSFVEPLLTANPYLDAIAAAEVFDERAVAGGIERILYDDGARDELARARHDYLAAVDALPPTAEVFAEALRAAR